MTTDKQTRERSFIAHPHEVRAILDNRQIQFRRVMKSQPPGWITEWGYTFFTPRGYVSGRGYVEGEGPGERFVKLPYSPGDLLCVKETWKPGAWREDGRIAIDYKASPELTNTPWLEIPDDDFGEKFEDMWIKLTDELEAAGAVCDEDGMYHWEAGQSPLKWRSPVTMPRWASRLTLGVTAVRVEASEKGGWEWVVEFETPSPIAEDKRKAGLDLSGWWELSKSVQRQRIRRLLSEQVRNETGSGPSEAE